LGTRGWKPHSLAAKDGCLHGVEARAAERAGDGGILPPVRCVGAKMPGSPLKKQETT